MQTYIGRGLFIQPAPFACLAASPFLIHPKDTYVKEGDRITLRCKVESNYRIVWLYKNKKLDRGANEDGKLVIKNFGSEDEGDYRCSAKKIGSAFTVLSKVARVYLAFTEKMERDEFKVEATTNNYAIIKCKVPRSKPEAEIYFEFNRRRLYIDRLENHFLMDDGYLHIVSVTEKNSGRYQCFSKNHISGQVQSGYVTNLIVKTPTVPEKPSFYRDPPKKIFIIEGENATIPCCIKSVPPPVIRWGRHPNSLQLPHPRIFQRSDNAIHITKVIPEDQGYYMCQATTADTEQSTYLQVNLRPKVTVERRQIYERSGTRNVQIRCNVRGVPEPKVKWYVNGKPVKKRTSKSLKIKRKSIKDIHN
ncbi:DgyrCDS4154 [Dimorphilus gyrociliatus]|uniref:DgyrCDS4154 n=1 Tax=Dimorphilus gyrociliatus TaxID=2664684 RepID=A0A7I8VG33_9ANNE|nr:DgyrCDS4154 [Dimorphilus gyrociliatus]